MLNGSRIGNELRYTPTSSERKSSGIINYYNINGVNQESYPYPGYGDKYYPGWNSSLYSALINFPFTISKTHSLKDTYRYILGKISENISSYYSSFYKEMRQGERARVYLNDNITISKNLTFSYVDTFVSGSTVTIKNRAKINMNNLIHVDGILDIQNGRVNIAGDYLMRSGGSPSSGSLKMQDEEAYLYIGGNCVIYPYNNQFDYLTAGTIEVKGDFTQYNFSPQSYETFVPTGTHRVLLSGTGKQTVNFNTKRSYFNILEITNTSTEGVEFVTYVVVNTLFNHNSNRFILRNGGSFSDYDQDGIHDHLDLYPLDAANVPPKDLTIQELSVDQNNIVYVKICNNLDTTITGSLIVAIYEERKLIDFIICNNMSFISKADTIVDDISFTISLTDSYTVKAFVWTSANSMAPISNVKEL